MWITIFMKIFIKMKPKVFLNFIFLFLIAYSTAGAEKYLLLPGDILYINVPDNKQLTHEYDVGPAGYIYVMIIGKLYVKGMDIKELEDRLTTDLANYIEKGKRITVKLVKKTRYIQIAGGIKYPGWYRVPYITTVKDIIEMAGGVIHGANLSNIVLKREGKIIKEDITKAIKLAPDDIIYIPPPKEYIEKVDSGDLLFVSIPQRIAPTPVPSPIDIMNLQRALALNKIQVDEKGYIYVPEYGHFYVNNKSPQEIEKMIKEKMPKYLQKAGKVDVGIIEKRHYVHVLGHVVKPGKYNVPEKANIQEVIATAGGAVDGAVLSDIEIRRKRKNGKYEVIKVILFQFKATGDPRLLTPVHKGDVIFVPISPTFGNIKRSLMPWSPPHAKLEKETKKKIKVLGAVNRPGIYEPKEELDLLTLIAQAGGLRDDAEISNILIIRGGKVYMRYDLEKFLGEFKTGVKGIPKILPGDTVYVSFVQKVEYEARERVFVIGNVNSPGAYELYDNMTVLQALGWAGGLNEWADKDHIVIVRMVGGKQQNIPFSYRKAVEGKYPEVNIRLKANDVIVVP